MKNRVVKKIVVVMILCVTLLVYKADTTEQGRVLFSFLREKNMRRPDKMVGREVSSPLPIIISQNGTKEEDRIRKLPGQPGCVDLSQYGGYITVDAEAGRALYYYFVEAVSTDQASNSKLLLWLNGGPGCSSLGFGAMEEIGPFRVQSDGKTLQRNPYAWNEVANVIFLESPAGVGFSYSNTKADYKLSGDTRTAEDTYVFLVNWYERFPEYRSKDLFIAGESYAGHYVPQLASIILQRNKLTNNAMINLKGIAMGNAVINFGTDEMGKFDFLWSHAIISDEVIDVIHKYCGRANGSKSCEKAFQEAYDNLVPINSGCIYAPICISQNLTDTPRYSSINDVDPCMSVYVNNYLNLPEVQEALHANVTKLNYPWSVCSRLGGWQDSAWSTLPLMQEAMAQGVRVYIYSGDTDAIVSVTSTRYSIKELRLTIKTPCRPWFTDNEVGGYTLAYEENLTFATVIGAGHEVSLYKPSQALAIAKSFLNGVSLPS